MSSQRQINLKKRPVNLKVTHKRAAHKSRLEDVPKAIFGKVTPKQWSKHLSGLPVTLCGGVWQLLYIRAKLVDFKPGDVALYEINPHYHVPNRPFFDTVELKGGGDATSAARAVLQTGEYDFAWTIWVDKDVRERMEQQGRKGAFRLTPSARCTHIQLNRTDPWTEVDGERSSIKVPHPFFADLRVRQAFAAAIDRRTIVEQLHGAAGQLSSNFLNTPT